jgi:hypothetical protein
MPGDHRITYISVVKGKKRMPRSGQNQLPPKAALNMAGRANQMMNVPSLGNMPATKANRQGIVVSS